MTAACLALLNPGEHISCAGDGFVAIAPIESALAYATMHEQRVLAMGASAVQFKVFDVNEPLSRITFGIP